MTINYHEIITIEPGKRSGKLWIRGLRITVDDILDCFAAGMTEQEVYSRLTLIERWTSFCGNKDQAIDFIQDMANESRLPEYHPIAGVVDSVGGVHVNGLFNLSQVHEIELMYFPELELQALSISLQYSSR